jgi:predicted neuraminidase
MVAADQEEAEGGKCERIKLPLCQDLGYNWTAMPNLVGHKDQKEAEEAVRLYIISSTLFIFFSSTNVDSCWVLTETDISIDGTLHFQ